MSIEEERGLIGTWRLIAYEARDSKGQSHYPIGKDVTGQLIYDANGNMSAHIMRNDRPTFATDDSRQGTDTEVRAAFEGYISYFGTYTMNSTGRSVTHHLQGCSYPNWVGNDQVRYYKFDDGRLVLSTPPLVSRGESLAYILTWGRADART